MEEGVVTTAAEADLGSILGWGFPAWTGGTLSYIDTIGIREFVAECDRLAEALRQAVQAVEVAARAGGARRAVPSGGGRRIAGSVSSAAAAVRLRAPGSSAGTP